MRRSLLTVALFAAACGAPVPEDTGEIDLPLGDRSDEDVKADGEWGAALTCKPAPNLPALVNPRITVSIDGLTVHLTDAATGYDKVFPVGVGAIETKDTAASFGESMTYEPVIFAGRQDFAITPSSIQPCKTWWTDPETGKKQPVFAGLPFMSFWGGYALHGPIDNFRAPNGGNLRRGYVSHGCVRMEAADVLEVYARIKTRNTPVHVQREPERLSDGSKADLPAKWIGAECDSDYDCNFTNGFCHRNPVGGRGFCSARCTSTCADRAGLPVTFCVTDPDDTTRGMCVAKQTSVNYECRPYDHFVPKTMNRHRSTVRATVCVPGSRGWVGDRCLGDGDCKNGTSCESGVCTQSCARFCPDMPSYATTFCANEMGGTCLRACTPASNASECPADFSCQTRARVGQPSVTRSVCVPPG